MSTILSTAPSFIYIDSFYSYSTMISALGFKAGVMFIVNKKTNCLSLFLVAVSVGDCQGVPFPVSAEALSQIMVRWRLTCWLSQPLMDFSPLGQKFPWYWATLSQIPQANWSLAGVSVLVFTGTHNAHPLVNILWFPPGQLGIQLQWQCRHQQLLQ